MAYVSHHGKFDSKFADDFCNQMFKISNEADIFGLNEELKKMLSSLSC